MRIHVNDRKMLLLLGVACVVWMLFRITSRYDRTILKMEAYLEHIHVSENGATYVNGPTVHMSDPRLVKKIASVYLFKPAPKYIPYNLDNPNEIDPTTWQAKEVLYLLNDKRNGFFVECGAYTGEAGSNTLTFEKNFNWEGLLIEAVPEYFKTLVSKRRKAYASLSCVCSTPYPLMVLFKDRSDRNLSGTGMISRLPAGSNLPGHRDVQCFPLYSYLLALNRTTVDYLSLNVQGAELDILRTIPFEKLDIKTLSVDYSRVPEGKCALKRFMEQRGYEVHYPIFKEGMNYNYIFFKNDQEDYD